MFCARCGKEIDNDSTFCPFCGQSTNEPVESGGGGKPKVSVKMPGKKVIGGIAVVAVVLLVVFGISKVIGGISNRAKSLPEKLFAMSAEEYVSLTREGFKDMLEEEGTLYKESDLNVRTLTTDDFMSYDCIYGYGAYDDDWGATPSYTAGLADCAYFVLAFETEEDFKEGQKSVKKYLEKEIVKKSGILKTDGAVWSGDTYLVECSDKGTDEVWKKLSEMDDRKIFYHDWIYYNYALAERKGIIYEDSQSNEEAFLKTLEDIDYKMYKFVQVCYPQMDSDLRSYFPSDKSYTDYTCCIQVTCLPMTEEDYILFAGQWGFDAISGKEMDIDEFKESVNRNLVSAYLDENESDDSEVRRDLEKELYIRLYMMENHNFNMFSKTYIESEDEKKLWYIRNFDWDTDKNALTDLSNYQNSSSIYCAVEYNYNSDTEEYFESELDRALYLADRDYKADTGESFGGTDDKRFWFMQNYGYDTKIGKEVDKEVADALIAYQKCMDDGVLDEYSEYRYNLVYINNDNIPECRVWGSGGVPNIMSHVNGEVQIFKPEKVFGNISFKSTSKTGKFAIVSHRHTTKRDYAVISVSLNNTFEILAETDTSIDYSNDIIEYTLNGNNVDKDTFQDVMAELSEDKWDYSITNSDNSQSVLAAYDALRTTIYETNEYCIYEYELKDGILTVKADDGASADINSFGTCQPFEFSYPVADDCVWQEGGHGYGDEALDGSWDVAPEDIEKEIRQERKIYDTAPDELQSPPGIQFRIIDDEVIAVYTSKA